MRKKIMPAVLVSAVIAISSHGVMADNINLIIDEDIPAVSVNTVNTDGNMLVSLREISEKIGGNIFWIDKINAAVLLYNGNIIKIKPGSSDIYANGETVHSTVPAQIIDGSTMISTDAIASVFDCETTYNLSKNTLYIATKPYDDKMLAAVNANSGTGSVSGGGNISGGPAIGQSMSLECSADTYVRGGDDAAKNFGTATTLDYKATKDAAYLRYVFLTFDLSKITGKSVSSATIKLYLQDAEDSGASVPVSVCACDDFDETAVTFKEAPAAGDKISSASCNGLQKYQEFDVTDYINSKLAQGANSASVILNDESAANKRLIFAGRESANPPVLDVK